MPLVLLCLLLGTICLHLPRQPEADAAPSHVTAKPVCKQTVYLARGLSPENLATLSAGLATIDPSAVLLLDTPTATKANKAYLAALKPDRVLPIGDYTEDVEQLTQRLGIHPEVPHHWSKRPPLSFWREFYPKAANVIVCPSEPRSLLYQAACLAGTTGAPLYVTRGTATDSEELQALLQRWGTKHIQALGESSPLTFDLEGVRVQRLKSERDVAAAHCRLLTTKKTTRTLVLANPFDDRAGAPTLAALAPWIALRRDAALLLTRKEGIDVDTLVSEAIHTKELKQADVLIMVADQESLPVRKRTNPIPEGKDDFIEMEPLTPAWTDPFTFCVGRMFHPDPGIVALMLAREKLLNEPGRTPKVLLASNNGGGLPLLEAISRQTARELRNGGYDTTAIFGKAVSGTVLREKLPEQDVFLWEGHHNVLIRDWSFPEWKEPLRPSLIFLQSCLALREWKVQPLFDRGAIGVIGSSTRTYSASGGATSLAFFNAIMHDDLSIGEALRQTKNFLQAYVLLKEGRLGDDVKRSGANQRAAWSFTLWGDPTLKLPRAGTPTQPPVRHEVKGNTITFHLPKDKLDPVHSEKYHAEAYPNSRLAGLTGKEKGDEGKPLQGMIFAEVHLPNAPEGKLPRLSSKLPSRSYAFNWDARLRRGYLVAVPRSKDTEQILFKVHWDDVASRGQEIMPGAEE